MKKILLVLKLVVLVIFIMGCSKEDSEEVIIPYDTYGNELLDEIVAMQDSEAPWIIFDIIRSDIEEVSDPAIKQEILDIANSTVPQIVETKNEYELRRIFYPEYNQIPGNYTFHEYFTDESENILLDTLNPTYAFLNNKGYSQEYYENYQGVIHIDDRVIESLDANNIEYKFPNKSSSHFVITEDNFVIEREGFDSAVFIYQVLNKDGEIIDPTDLLGPIDTILKNKESEKLNKVLSEKAEAQRIKIGMTMMEVSDRLGEGERVSKTTSSFGVKETWKFGNDYYYFEDGILYLISEN